MRGETMVKKGWGRIYVMDNASVERVREIAKNLDTFEWGYYVDGMIAHYDPTKPVRLIYTCKFEVNLDALSLLCWREGIAIWCISQHNEEFVSESDIFSVGRRVLLRNTKSDEFAGAGKIIGSEFMSGREGIRFKIEFENGRVGGAYADNLMLAEEE